MKNIDDLFWNAKIDELSKGYIYNDDTETFVCLLCGTQSEKGLIYQDGNQLFEAEKYMKYHITQEHGSVFSYLLKMNKKYTGLTEHQNELLKLFYQGLSDKEIVKELGGGSIATIRNHRFKMKEKEKQAKIFLTIMELLNQKAKGEKMINIHKGAKMVDERFNITEAEREKVINTYFDPKSGKLNKLPSKEKRKIIVLQKIAKEFEINRKYSEKEVNEIIKVIFEDFVTIRRYLIEYGFMERNKDGSAYWVKI